MESDNGLLQEVSWLCPLQCYADVMARRLKTMGLEKYRNGFGLTLHEEDLEEPLQGPTLDKSRKKTLLLSKYASFF